MKVSLHYTLKDKMQVFHVHAHQLSYHFLRRQLSYHLQRNLSGKVSHDDKACNASDGVYQRNGKTNNQKPKYVLVDVNSWSNVVILNRPSALNSLNRDMVDHLRKIYKKWESDPAVLFVMIKGNGGTFCSGSDLLSIYHDITQGKMIACRRFFKSLYKFAFLLSTYSKPHVAILDGITMGGGTGVSIPGTFRVVSDNTVFSIPQICCGFHPDAGASFYLSRLPGHLGEYLALTGEKLNGYEMLEYGLATHLTPSTDIAALMKYLGALVSDDRLTTALSRFTGRFIPSRNRIAGRLETIDKCFGLETVEEIICALEREVKKGGHWVTSALGRLKQVSPLMLKVSLKSIREGRNQTLEQCLVREYRTTLHCISKDVSNDFIEGLRARLVDKDSSPKWHPPSLEAVTKDMVDHYFSPIEKSQAELQL
ncbi:hypothetical protein H6P81_005294 [Aristolochia fimbriata]|uniref:3-hydroxyisobutyryl-CoA hydrolase n=1 Tax=Aristolochia fimbriata TaxID=158543 RepID=A0AAV7EU23_ARIFI|nr:hypothetical protein H6P81_005294 [Aristolochia fimbriata]